MVAVEGKKHSYSGYNLKEGQTGFAKGPAVRWEREGTRKIKKSGYCEEYTQSCCA